MEIMESLRLLSENGLPKQVWNGKVMESIHLVKEILDWSACRSIPRAQRRASAISRRGRKKRSHQQRVRRRLVPDNPVIVEGTLYCHPDTFRALKERLAIAHQKPVEAFRFGVVL